MAPTKSLLLPLSLILLLCLTPIRSSVQFEDQVYDFEQGLTQDLTDDHDHDHHLDQDQDHDHDHSFCGHAKYQYDPEFMEVDEEPLPGQQEQELEGRVLQAAAIPNIRVFADYSTLVGTAQFQNYIRNTLMPPVIAYIQGALRVRQPVNGPLRLAAGGRLCGAIAVPQSLVNGVNADLFLAVGSVQDAASSFAAFAQTCNMAASGRPTIGRVVYNTAFTRIPANAQDITHENNIYLALHEVWHVLGHANNLYPFFIDAAGRRRQGHVTTLTQNRRTYTVLNVEPLTSNLRRHFGCQTLRGAVMENDGGSGTAGSHFEKRFFLFEFMTGMSITGSRVSTFSLNLMEGTGWYAPNYAFAEPFFFGQGQGCAFTTEDCSTATRRFPEFCGAAGQGCTPAGRGAGQCANHPFTDGCLIQVSSNNRDCEHSNALNFARLPRHETYGPGLGSRCFSGTLSTGQAAQSGFCFRFTCNGSGAGTTVTVNVGGNNIVCNARGNRTVPGLTGVLNCPDPLSFCSMQGRQYCPRNCMGRGRCVNNRCQCNAGTRGVDCGGV